MILSNVHRIGDEAAGDINISGGRITDTNAETGELRLFFNDAIAIPGLINSHDHLDFNLFPQLGDQLYNNYTEWGNYIHQHYQQDIAAVLKVPLALRTQWGLYKNLLCGVTTVVNHGDKLEMHDAPIQVIDNVRSLHSVHFDKTWRRRLNDPFRIVTPAVIHTGEGTDELAVKEIDELIRWNLLNSKLIGVHGVAMTAQQARQFKALVWCPVSNFYLLGHTAHIDELKKHTRILFGTDSTLTGDWNIWTHLRKAQRTGMLTNEELFQSATTTPASVWQTNNGALTPGTDADIVITKLKGRQPSVETVLATDPSDILLVIQKGHIRLFDEQLYSQLSSIKLKDYSKIVINGAYKYVYGDLPALMSQIRQFYAAADLPVNCTCHQPN